MITRRALAGVLPLLAAGAPLGCADPDARGGPSGVAPPGQPVSIGRYDLAVPRDARLIGRAQRLRSLAVRVDPAPPGITPDAALALAATPGTGTAANALGGRRERIAPGTLLLTRDWVDGIPVTDTAAVRLLPGLVVTAAGQHESPEGRAAQREAAIAIVAAAVPDHAPGGPGFAADRVTFGLPFHWQESAVAGFTLGPGTHLSVETQTNGGRTGRRLLEGTGSALARMAGIGVGATPLRARPRPLAGHPGEELVLRRGGRAEFLLQWAYAGEPNSGDRPALSIRLEVRNAPDEAALLAEWDAMLASLRRRA